jgi:hypothetical protein
VVVQAHVPGATLRGLLDKDVGATAVREQRREQDGQRLRTEPMVVPETVRGTAAQANPGVEMYLSQHLPDNLPGRSVEVVRVAEVASSSRPVEAMEPPLLVGGQGLLQLGCELA